MGLMHPDSMVRIEVTVVKMHDQSVRVDYEGEEAWIPYSLIEDESEIDETSEDGDEGALVIPRWKAQKLGFL